MNGLTDSPFLFFMENMPPIYSADSCNDTRKIIELRDTGCDARTSPMAVPPNVGQYHRVKTPKNNNWRTRDEEQWGNRVRKEKYQGYNESNVNHDDEFHLKQDQTYQHQSTQQNHYQKEFPYEDDCNHNETVFKRRPTSANVNPDSKVSPEKSRTRRWNRDIYYKPAQEYQNDTMMKKTDQSYQRRKESKINEDSQYSRSNCFKVNPNAYQNEVIGGRENVGPVEDYPEDFETEQALRNPSRNQRNRWQHRPAYNGRDNSMDETSQKSHRFLGYNSRVVAAPNSAKISDCSRRSNDARSSRIRSRTCSPPTDRRKTSKPVAKTVNENVDQTDDNVKSFQNENLHTDRETKLVDRAVDKASLLDVSNVYDCTDFSSNTLDTDAEKNQRKTGFWEFIPLDDNCEQKSKKMFEKLYSRSNTYSLSESLDSSKGNSWKVKKQIGKMTVDSASTKSPDYSPPLLTKNKKNFSSEFSRVIHLTKAFLESGETKFSLNSEKDSETINKSKDQVQNNYEMKNEDRSEGKLPFELSDKASRYLGRPNSASKSESNSDKKKKLAENNASNISDGRKLGKSFIEKTTASLKRKLEKSKTDETMLNHCSLAMREGKIRSKLPIRIRSRLRSKNPLAISILSTLKTATEFNKSSVEPVTNSDDPKSIRSRTKPRAKPSVELSKVVLDSVAASENQLIGGYVPAPQNIDNYGGSSHVPEAKLGKNDAGNNPMEYVNKRNLSKSKLIRDKERSFDKNEPIGVSKSSYKDKCFFHSNDTERMVCNSCSKAKTQKYLNPLRSKKIADIKSRL